MDFEITKIILAEKSSTPKIGVMVSFNENKQYFAQRGSVDVYLDFKDYTISEIKTEAVKAAKEFLLNAVNAITE